MELFKKMLPVLYCCLFMVFCSLQSLSDYAREKGFVYLDEIDPTILSSVRYYTDENFVGTSINGYKKPVIIITKQAALALKNVQEEFKKAGYCLVVYDAYRPQQAVDHFISWSEQAKEQVKKEEYYPDIDKNEAFQKGYIARRSGHSRGSTVDVTIIQDGQLVKPIQIKSIQLLDGRELLFLDDGTIDMGSSFDCLDEVSHTDTDLVEEQYRIRRTYLKHVMEKYGFKNYYCEWWHFTLDNEPYSADHDDSYFNFPIE